MLKKKIRIGYDNLAIKNIAFKDKTLQGEYDAHQKVILLEKNLKGIKKVIHFYTKYCMPGWITRV